MDLDALDREGADVPGPFTVTVAGARYVLADPTGLPWQAIARLGGDIEHDVHSLLGDQADEFRRHPMPVWKLNRLVDAWKEHHSLGGVSASSRCLSGTARRSKPTWRIGRWTSRGCGRSGGGGACST
ncbi:hypothetical protein ACWEQ7_02695 [Streptomyces sp. NPDC004069]